MREDYQEPPPPPPEPPPEDPPPDELPLLPPEEDEDVVIFLIEWIVEFIDFEKVSISNPLVELELYQLGCCSTIFSNLFIHLSDTPKAYVYGKILK